MSLRVDVLADGLRFPEGPLFGVDGELWCVELAGEGVVRRDRDATVRRVPTGGRPNGLALGRDGRVWIADAARGEIRRLDPDTGTAQTMAAGLNAPNDLAFDALGNLVFTCPGDSRRKPTGTVRCLRPGGETSVIADGLYFPNGLAFADDGATLLIAETYRRRLWRGAWHATARRWDTPAVFCVTAGEAGQPGGPDGIAIGADGCVYVAVYGTGNIEYFAPDGTPLASIAVPGRNPTNCAFDPAGALGLVVTEAERGLLLSHPELGPGAPLFAGPDA